MEAEQQQRMHIFIDKLFADLELSHIGQILARSGRRKTPMVKLVIAFRKRMFLLFFGLQVLHLFQLEQFFTKVHLCRRYVFTLIASHCFSISNHCPNVFIAFIYTCSFVYTVADFCREKGLPEIIQLSSMCAKEVFDHRLQQEFDEQGGYEKLKEYIESDRVVEIIDLMAMLHLKEECRTTKVQIDSENHDFTATTIMCYEEFIERLPLLTNFAQNIFPNEMAFNTQGMERILWAFAKMEAEMRKFIEENPDPSDEE